MEYLDFFFIIDIFVTLSNADEVQKVMANYRPSFDALSISITIAIRQEHKSVMVGYY